MRAVTYVEEVQLIWVGGSNAGCEKQQVTLQPSDLERRELETNTWT